MKKGQAPPNLALPIIIGIVVLAIAAVLIFRYGSNIGAKISGEKSVFKQTTEEETAIIRGTVKKGAALQTITLPNQRDAAIQDLASEIVRCWNYMKTGKIDSYRHATIILPRFPTGITQKELVTQAKKWNTDAGDVLNSDWKEPYDKGDILIPGTYLLCCDYDSAGNSDIYLSTDVTFDCE